MFILGFQTSDLRVTLHTKRWFDAVGHYSREDVLPGRSLRGSGWLPCLEQRASSLSV